MIVLEVIVFFIATPLAVWHYATFGTVEVVSTSIAALSLVALIYNAMRDSKREKLDNEMADFERIKFRQSQQKEDPAVLLEKLGELKNKGLLTEEEFNSKKAEILARM